MENASWISSEGSRTARGPFDYDYCLIDSPGQHPERIGEFDDAKLHDVLSNAHEREAIAAIEREDPTLPTVGTGADFVAALDAEWTEHVPGVLSCEAYQFYGCGVGGDLAMVCYPALLARRGPPEPRGDARRVRVARARDRQHHRVSPLH
jgi:hypothetical protein